MEDGYEKFYSVSNLHYHHNAENLIASSRAVVLLRKKNNVGEVHFTDNAKDIWMSDPVFTEHTLDKFGTILSRTGAEDMKQGNDNLF